jgi:hypothetical protein
MFFLFSSNYRPLRTLHFLFTSRLVPIQRWWGRRRSGVMGPQRKCWRRLSQSNLSEQLSQIKRRYWRRWWRWWNWHRWSRGHSTITIWFVWFLVNCTVKPELGTRSFFRGSLSAPHSIFPLDRWPSCVQFLNFPFRLSLKRSSLKRSSLKRSSLKQGYLYTQSTREIFKLFAEHRFHNKFR